MVRHGLDIICQETAIGLGGEVRNLRRTGSGSLRTQRHKKFYPIYIDTNKQCVVEIGEYLPLDQEPSYDVPNDVKKRFPDSSLSVIWPFDEDGVQKIGIMQHQGQKTNLSWGNSLYGNRNTAGKCTTNLGKGIQKI